MEPATADGLGVPRFARGFVLSEHEVAPPVPGWSSETVLGLHLTRAPEVPLTQAEHAGSSVVVLGHLIDTAHWLPQTAAVTAAAEALARSESAFLDLTDAWSGRYLLLYGTPSSRRVMTDAAGVRSAFHALEGPFVLATHARLVADIVGAAASPIADAYVAVRQAMHKSVPLPMPGRSTPWTGVVFLTANMVLEVEERRRRPDFPRGDLPTMDTQVAASAIAPRLRGQVESLVASGRPIALSVTAGRDSRVSLAASRPCRDAIQYFTYARSGLWENEWDVATATSMATALGLPHRVVELTKASPELTEALEEATVTSHSNSVADAYRRSFSRDTIHIRSNVGEVGRSFYRGKSWGQVAVGPDVVLTPETIARLWAHDVPLSPIVVEAFDDWMQAVGFADVQGLDLLDVLYWEHRMACWHSNVVLESDFAFDTHVLFNARTILRDLLAVPAADRARSKAFELLVADLWPELERWPYRQHTERQKPTPDGGARAGGIRRRLRDLLAR